MLNGHMRAKSDNVWDIGSDEAKFRDGHFYRVMTTSDARVKCGLTRLGSALDKVDAITGYTYSFCNDVGGRRHAGLVAQEVVQVLPEVVKEGNMMSINYSGVVALLVEAVKELRLENRRLSRICEELIMEL